MPLYKNQSGQIWAVYVWDTVIETPKTGDAANITGQISIDGGAPAPTNDVNPTELDATDAPGVYVFNLPQAETNGDHIALQAKSGTANIGSLPLFEFTLPNLADDGTSPYDRTTDSLQAQRDAAATLASIRAGLVLQETTIATLSSQTSFTLTAGSVDNLAYVNCTIVIEDVSTSTQKAVGIISAYTGSTKTVTLKWDPSVFTMAATDKIYILSEMSLKPTAQNRQLDVTATGAAGIDWGNVENPTTTVDLAGTDFQLVDTTTTLTTAGSGSITAASFGAGAIDAAALATNAVNEIRDAIRKGIVLVETTIATLANQGSWTLAGGSSDDDAYNDRLAIVIDSSSAMQAAPLRITDYTGDSKTVTAVDPAIFTMAVGDTVIITSLPALTLAWINTEMLDVLNVDTFTEPSPMPSANATIVDMLHTLFSAYRGKKIFTKSTGVSQVRDDVDGADLWSSTSTDDGSVLTSTKKT